jgi:hypothetical protein
MFCWTMKSYKELWKPFIKSFSIQNFLTLCYSVAFEKLSCLFSLVMVVRILKLRYFSFVLMNMPWLSA